MSDQEHLLLIAEALDCPVETLDRDSALGRHPAWDSMGQLNIMLALERRFGLPITDETIRVSQSVEGVRATFERHGAPRNT